MGTKIKLGGIIEHTHLNMISLEEIPDRAGIAGLIFQTLGNKGINVQFIIHCLSHQGQSQVILCISRSDSDQTLATLNELKPRIGFSDLSVNTEIGVLSIFGPHFRERPGIAGIFFNALSSRGINIMAISTSISTCSCIIKASSMPEAIKAIGEVFDLPGNEE